jgi:hypothetical protein
MKTTTFKQDINGTLYTITVPVTRVEKLLDRVDAYNDASAFKKAFKSIAPFIGATATKATPPKVDKVDRFGPIIEQYRNDGRRIVMRHLMDAGLSRAASYNRARKADVQ